MRKQRMFVGMSGGVDSSVTAALLVRAGYDVTGVYMKNWSTDLPGMPCPWRDDYQDAKRVAVQLGIPFKMYDFESEYRQNVVDYMVAEYKAGRTPNPDVMCNQEIKFKLFYDAAMADGADFIATGHYARLEPVNSLTSDPAKEPPAQANDHQADESHGEIRFKSDLNRISNVVGLARAKDENKDQTYFLYRVSSDALQKTLFPLGNLTKPEVRKLAEEFGLVTANKKESMGICFVGKVGIRDFLTNYITDQADRERYFATGDIVDQNGAIVGQHDGAIFYTIGQRHGLDVGGGLPFYVRGKDMAKNQVLVTTNLDDENLWADELMLKDIHWIGDPSAADVDPSSLQVRTRHRAPLVTCTNFSAADGQVTLTLKDPIRAATPGQSAVIYQGNHCLGGGIIT